MLYTLIIYLYLVVRPGVSCFVYLCCCLHDILTYLTHPGVPGPMSLLSALLRVVVCHEEGDWDVTHVALLSFPFQPHHLP